MKHIKNRGPSLEWSEAQVPQAQKRERKVC